MRTRADQIYEAFKKFHLENPMVWDLFKQYTFMIIERDFHNYGVAAVFERIRWHVEIETRGELKLNNNFRAYYSRMFESKFPEHEGFFRKRKRISENQEPHNVDIQQSNFGTPQDEMALYRDLAELP
jgi:hypothetical protein